MTGRRLGGPTSAVLHDVLKEREAQHAKWGEQNHPNETGPGSIILSRWTFDASRMKRLVDRRAETGSLGWSDILAEEVAEAFEEYEPVKLREELIQIAAVAVAWVEAIDRRQDHD